MRANGALDSSPYTRNRTHIFTNVQFRFAAKPRVPEGRTDVCDTSDFQPILLRLSRDENNEETLTRLSSNRLRIFSPHIVIQNLAFASSSSVIPILCLENL